MSDSSGSRPADAPTEGSRSPEADAEALAAEVQPTPEQPYDVPSGAQQYGQPPATGYQPPVTDPPGQSAPVEGPGPQQYGQPEHGQASYAQEGFPAPSTGTDESATSQQPSYDQPGYVSPPPYVSQQPYGQQPYPYQQPYGAQPPYGSQPGYAGQQPYAGPGGYPSQGYPQPYPAAAAPMSESDQRLWATLTNISIPFFFFVGPLVAYVVLKDRSPFLKDSTTEALNFSILFSIAVFVSSILTAVVIGVVLLPIIGVVALVFCILAAMRANKGEVYRYPLNWRLVK